MLPCDGSPFPVCFSLSTVRAHHRERTRQRQGRLLLGSGFPLRDRLGGGCGGEAAAKSSAHRSIDRSLWWLLHLMGVIVWPRPVCLISTLPLPGQGGAVFPERGDWKASEEASEAGQLL